MPYSSNFPSNYPFQHLVGRWMNRPLPNGSNNEGGQSNPLSYNVMPLPQNTPQPNQPDYGYILKNFTYYETVQFNDRTAIATPVNAPNRGGNYTQNSFALFYDQQVHFAEGPAIEQIVHEENGAWLYLTTAAQTIGPYSRNGTEPGPVPPQPEDIEIAKQIAVPHGNSILALGSVTHGTGSPVIPDSPPPFAPPGLDNTPFEELLSNFDNYQNPQPELTRNPNSVLQQAVNLIRPNAYIHWRVTTKPLPSGQGIVTNIPFEQRRANVNDYEADYWLLSTDGGESFPFLSYSQSIFMNLTIHDQPGYLFPHVTCNTVTKL